MHKPWRVMHDGMRKAKRKRKGPAPDEQADSLPVAILRIVRATLSSKETQTFA